MGLFHIAGAEAGESEDRRNPDPGRDVVLRQLRQCPAGEPDGLLHVAAHGGVGCPVRDSQRRYPSGVRESRFLSQRVFQFAQGVLGGFSLAGHIEHARGDEADPGVGLYDLVWQRVQPAHERGGADARPGVHLENRPLDHAGCQVKIRDRQRMVDGFGGEIVLLVPRRRSKMQPRHLIWLCFLQAGAQQFGKEAVIAVPPALVVERHHEQIGLLQVFEDLLARGRSAFILCRLNCEGIAESAAHPLQDTGSEQKGVDRFRLALEDFIGQVVEDEMMPAGKAIDESRHAVRSPAGYARLERKRGHLQAGDPALRLSVQGSHLGGFKIQPHCLIEKRGRFLERKAQVALADLGDLTASTQPGKRNGRVLARVDDQVHVRRLSLQ